MNDFLQTALQQRAKYALLFGLFITLQTAGAELPFATTIVEVDEVYHLACPASPKYYQKDPIQTTKVNVLGAINMLVVAKSARHISSALHKGFKS